MAITDEELEDWKSNKTETVPFEDTVECSIKFNLKAGYTWLVIGKYGLGITHDNLLCPCSDCGHIYQAECEMDEKHPDCCDEVCS